MLAYTNLSAKASLFRQNIALAAVVSIQMKLLYFPLKNP
jgi:hypothetical protein